MKGSPTADRLLSVARRLFAEQGYHGTSIRQIVTRAEANLGAVTYHFGSKERLYHAVLAQAIAPLVDRIARAAQGPGSALDRLEGVARAYFAHLDENRDLPALMSREMVRHGPLPPPLRDAIRRITDLVVDMIAAGQAEGILVPGNPMHLMLSLLSQPIYFALVRPALAKLTNDQTETAEWRKALVDHALRFARRGLALPATTGRP